MARYRHIIFVCLNHRDVSDPRGCCSAKGAEALLDELRRLVHAHGLKGKVRVTQSGCLDSCARGITVVVFSESQPAPETWYANVRPEDAGALFESHVLRGERLERLLAPRGRAG